MAKENPKPLVNEVDAEKSVVADHIDTVNINAPAAPPGGGKPERPTAKPPRNLPERNPRFVGRTTELDEIHRRLNRSLEIGVTQQTAAHAQGGVGKTSIAYEYAWRHLDDYPGGVFVLSCDTDQLLPAIAELAVPLGLPEGDTPEETAKRIKAQLENGEPALLILDNVRGAAQWGDSEWSRYLPAGNCRRLITTRAPHLPRVDMFHIERLPRDQGIELLAKYRSDASDEANRAVAGDIVDWFDGLAVGLTVAGVYMQLHPELGWEQFAKSLESRGLGAVRDSEKAVGKLPDYDQRVDAVFDDAVKALPPEQRRGLEYAALLPEDTVVRTWLAWLLEHDEEVTLPTRPGYEDHPADCVISELVSLDLLRPARVGKDILSVHRVLRRRLGEQLAAASAKRDKLLDAVVAMAEERGKASHDAVTTPALRSELTPLVALARELDAAGRFEAAVSLANWVSTPLRDLGRYVEAGGLLEPMVARCDSRPDLIRSDEHGILLNNLALTLQDLGDMSGARRLMELAVQIDQKHFEPDHPMLATSYSNLATILQELGELPEARRLMELAIQIDQKHFGPDHPILATRYSNLALILQDLSGNLDEARRLMERAIEIKEKYFDSDHPKLAIGYSNLALILRDLGELPEARRLMKQAIELEVKHLGHDHPTIATSFHNMAGIAIAEGKPAEALALEEKALSILLQHFDEDHPNVKTSRELLARYRSAVK